MNSEKMKVMVILRNITSLLKNSVKLVTYLSCLNFEHFALKSTTNRWYIANPYT